MKNAFVLALWLLTSTLFAGSINDAAKNPSMAVYSNTALANQTSVAFIPVAVSGAACNSTTDTIAITSDHSSQLICQSGVWTYEDVLSGSPTDFTYSIINSASYSLGFHKMCLLTLVATNKGGCYLTNQTGAPIRKNIAWNLSVEAYGLTTTCRATCFD